MKRGLFLLSSLVLGCRETPTEAPPSATGSMTRPMAAPLTKGPNELRLAGLRPQPGELLWEVTGDRALFVRLAETPENADPGLRFTARLSRNGAVIPWRYDGEVLAGARVLADRELVTTPDGTLHEVRGDSELTLDTAVVGAVAASPDGAHLAYATGEPPELEIARCDAGVPRRLTRDMAPAWSPGISADGRIVVFTSASTGVPAWWLVEDDRAPVQLTNRGVVVRPGVAPSLSPFAAGMGPTLLSSEGIVFESERGVVRLRLDGSLVETWPSTQRPFWLEPGLVGVVSTAGVETHSLTRSLP
jgi:hypothetical protein